MCVSEEVIFRENTPERTEVTSDGLFCVYKDNCKLLLYQQLSTGIIVCFRILRS